MGIFKSDAEKAADQGKLADLEKRIVADAKKAVEEMKKSADDALKPWRR